ncbi:MAG: hypothetical protein ACHQLA_06785 [Ignavibacteriales bacterium]
MKKLKFSPKLFYLLIVMLASFSMAQSDYITVQKFKQSFEEIKRQLKDASSLEDMNRIHLSIEEFTHNYSKNSELFDSALYPETYKDMISELNGSIALKESNFNVVEDLKIEVTDLKQKVDTLSIMNKELDIKLAELQSLFDKNTKETSRLKDVISELKMSLHKRDLLVMSMVDSLMPPVMREKSTLSSEEKEQIVSDVEKDNIMQNVKTTIRDNIKYLDLTSLQPTDIEEIQIQQMRFADTWSRIGPKLAEVYSDNRNRTSELLEIDSLFNLWTFSVENEAWQSMEEDFASNGVDLISFSDGEEFTSAVNQYIENEKNSINTLPEEEAKINFIEFAENTWGDNIKPKWVNFLISNGMLDESTEKEIEENIAVWRSEIYPSTWWLWVVIVGIALGGLLFLLKILKNSSRYDNVQEN